MTGWKIGKIANNQYGIVNLFIALTSIIWFITSLMSVYVVAPEQSSEIVSVILIGIIFVGLLILGLILYERAKKVKPTREYEDERSDMCSLKATRNGFIFALIFLAIYMIIGQMAPSSLYRIQALQAVFGVSVAAYIVSYFYYKRSF
jgi:hypothetical protein